MRLASIRLLPPSAGRQGSRRSRYPRWGWPASSEAPVEGPEPGSGAIAERAQQSPDGVAEPAARGEEGGMVESNLAHQLAMVVAAGLHVHARRFDAVAEERLRDTFADEPVLGRADPEVPVLVAPAHVRVVAADGAPDLAAEEGTGLQAVADTQGIDSPTPGFDPAGLFSEVLVVGVGNGHRWLRFQQGHRLFEHLGHEQVVRVEGQDVAPRRGGDPVVAGAREPLVHLAQEADRAIRMGRHQPLRLLRRVVRASVVDDDDLPVSERLGDNAGDRLTEVSRLAVAGDDDRDRGPGVVFGHGARAAARAFMHVADASRPGAVRARGCAGRATTPSSWRHRARVAGCGGAGGPEGRGRGG